MRGKAQVRRFQIQGYGFPAQRTRRALRKRNTVFGDGECNADDQGKGGYLHWGAFSTLGTGNAMEGVSPLGGREGAVTAGGDHGALGALRVHKRPRLVPEIMASPLKFGIRCSEQKHKLQVYILNIMEV